MIAAMRRSWLAAGFLLLVAGQSLACTCAGIGSIGDAFGNAERVVLGRIEGMREIPTSGGDGMVVIYPEAVVVKVLKVLKGSAPDEILVSGDFMCYRSFNVEDFKPGDVFVFPIVETNFQGVNVLPSCGHSALKLSDGQLYTHEPAEGGGHRLQSYMSLALAQWLVPLGLLDPRGQVIFGSGVALLACLVITWSVRRRTAGAASAAQATDPTKSLRSVGWISGFAIGWMLLCAGVCVLFGLGTSDWLPWTLGAMFALAAAGIALRWPVAEGLSYGLALIWIGICVVLTIEALRWLYFPDGEIDERFYYLMAIDVVCVGGMLWCADAVRRRYSTATP